MQISLFQKAPFFLVVPQTTIESNPIRINSTQKGANPLTVQKELRPIFENGQVMVLTRSELSTLN